VQANAATILRKLERRKIEFSEDAARHKRDLLRALEKRRLPRAADVLRLHEVLCFLRAYPDNEELLALTDRMLTAFADRADLRKHRAALANSGIAGTATCHAFFPATALWLAKHWGRQLSIVWEDFEGRDRLSLLLPQLALYCETPGLDGYAIPLREWIERLKGPRETDAEFILRRLAQVRIDPTARETMVEDILMPLQLAAGADTPARTREMHADAASAFQSRPLVRTYPSPRDMADRAPKSIRAVGPRQAQALIELARSAMASRGRELEAFAYADRNDVRMVNCGGGLQFAYIGVTPDRRLLLETLYGFLMLKNGMLVGYGTNTCLFDSSEVAFTVFDTFRGAEAAQWYGHMIGIARRMFHADTFVVDTYQLGDDNDDAIQSGAWWFYQRLGFRPREIGLRRIMRRELQRMKARPSFRSSATTLKKLASANMFLELAKAREDVFGVLPLANVALRITQYLAERFGYDRRKAERTCAREAADLLGVRSMRSFSPGQRLAWRRWSPLILILPNIKRWPTKDKKALVATVRAKGGPRESDYLIRFDRHPRLRRAIRTLATTE
jgi:hypothetical protein